MLDPITIRAVQIWSIIVAVTIPACAASTKPSTPDEEAVTRPPKKTSYPIFVAEPTSDPESVSAEEQRRVDENCLGRAPKKRESFGVTTVIGREDYALEHSAERKIPLWVCEHLTEKEVDTKVGKRAIRCNDGQKIELMKFLPDPRLPAGQRAELADYRGSGYDRGHMAPSADFTERWGAMEESFYLSNMAPQIGSGFNRSVWAELEKLVRSWADEYDEAWIFTGGFFKPNDEVWVIGDSEVYVPTWFYKIVVVKKGASYNAAAFAMENRAHSNTSTFQPFVVTIDLIESWSGLDFLTALPSNVSASLESSTADLTQW